MAGNANYQVADYTAFAFAQRLKKDWSNSYAKVTPLLTLIKKGGRFNKGVIRQGRAIIIPLLYAAPTTGAAGVTDANELVADTLSITNGFTQAEFPLSHYRMPVNTRSSEKLIAMHGQLGDFNQGKYVQMVNSFREVIGADIEGTGTGARDAMAGVAGIVATANTVGGIDQSANSWYRGSVTAKNGVIALTDLDQGKTTLSQASNEQGAPFNPDLLIASTNPSGVDVYSALYGQISPFQRVVDQGDSVDFGFETVYYRGMLLAQSHRIAAGTLQMLTSGSFYYGGWDEPVLGPATMIPGTDAETREATFWGYFGCDNPRLNKRWTNILG